MKTKMAKFLFIKILILFLVGCVPQIPTLIPQDTVIPAFTDTPIPTIPPTLTTVPTPNIIAITPAQIDSFDISLPIPTIGAQLDFSLEREITGDSFRRSPFDGVFMSNIKVDRYAPSWYAMYSNSPSLPAESDVCIMNMSNSLFPQVQTGPLNIKVSRISLFFAIYSDYRYTLEVKDIEVLIANFKPMDTKIEMVYVGQPGAGGQSYPFKSVQGIKVSVDGISNTIYKMDFDDFFLAPNNGVNIFVPIAMNDAGSYQFIIKVNGVATPTYAGEPAGKISLTSNVIDYSWVKLNNPTDYNIADFDGANGEKVKLDLIPCP